MDHSLEMIPLGGLGEFGMNCAVLRYGKEMILIDVGVMFPNGPLRGLGLDLIVPDITFLKENKKNLPQFYWLSLWSFWHVIFLDLLYKSIKLPVAP